MTQATRAGAENAAAEGFTPSFAAADITPRVRNNNQVQLLEQTFSASDTQEEVDKAGLGQSSEYDEQKDLKIVELKKDLAFDIINNDKVTRDADAGTAGQMDGILAFASGVRAKDANQGYLTQELFNQLTREITELSGETADAVYAKGYNRGLITSWTSGFKTFELAGKTTELVDTVEVYKGDWGRQMVIFDVQCPEAQIFTVKMGHLSVAYLVPIKHVEQAKGTIDGRQGFVKSEATLEVRNPNTVGKITNLKTA